MPQKYFIAYSGNNRRGNHVVGHAEITRLKPIAGIQDIFGIAEDICKSQNLADCAISGWQPFEAPAVTLHFSHVAGRPYLGVRSDGCSLATAPMIITDAEALAAALGKELIHS